jgi:hypothetical protein
LPTDPISRRPHGIFRAISAGRFANERFVDVFWERYGYSASRP